MTVLRCPVCRIDLIREAKSYRCSAGHSFDIARQGYVNLLLSTQRTSKAPGDTAAMLADRRAFLDAGYYLPLRAAIIARLDDLQADLDHPQHVLDLGCGEGYYTEAFASAGRTVFGLDIAKPALAIAARRNNDVTWCVATSRALPFHDASLDVVTSIFCRPHPVEIRRVLRPGGTLLIAGPTPAHLAELRAVLYEQVRTQESETFDAVHRQGFDCTGSDVIRQGLTLEQPAIGQLARMTPHYWRAPKAGKERLNALQNLSVTAEFQLQAYVAGGKMEARPE